jgi:hypothetical protein
MNSDVVSFEMIKLYLKTIAKTTTATLKGVVTVRKKNCWCRHCRCGEFLSVGGNCQNVAEIDLQLGDSMKFSHKHEKRSGESLAFSSLACLLVASSQSVTACRALRSSFSFFVQLVNEQQCR